MGRSVTCGFLKEFYAIAGVESSIRDIFLTIIAKS